MKPFCFLLLALAGCGQNATEHQAASASVASKVPVANPIPPVKPADTYTSGDREKSGPNDTLHTGNGLVLQLNPGSKNDFATEPRSQILYSEARTIRQEGNGRVYRKGHTLFVRTFNGPTLRFSDDTYQMRKDENEEMDTHCQFSGSVPGRPYWIVDSLQWERYQPFLINKYSGQTTSLSWNPEISPNRAFLLVATPGLDIESTLNGLQLWAISNQTVTLLWTKTLQNWQPQQVRWLDNHTIAIEQLRFQSDGTEKSTYVRLILPN